ncbi:putative ribonuclease H-like domain-containing protein [Tanacetum coccineum]
MWGLTNHFELCGSRILVVVGLVALGGPGDWGIAWIPGYWLTLGMGYGDDIVLIGGEGIYVAKYAGLCLVKCRFAKYQENRANGRREKKIVAIEDSNSKALVAKDNNEDIDWTKEFDAEPVTFAMMTLTGVNEDDWSIEIDSEPIRFGQDGLGDFDWSNTADDVPVSLALMATNSEVPYCSKCSKSYKLLLENYQKERDNFQKARHSHQRRSFIPSAVLTRDGLKSTARPKMTQTVPSKSTANVIYQGTARSRVPQAVLSRSTDGPYYPRMDNRRPRISSYSPSSRSSTTRTPYRPQRPKKIVKSIWVKKGSIVGSQAVLPQTVSVKKSAMITSKQTWRQKGDYLDSVNRNNGSYTLKQFEYAIQKEDLRIMLLMTVHNVLFTDKECLILSPKFKFVDEDLVILRAPRKNDVYSLDLKNIIPSGGVTCLVAKATSDEAVNFKNINKLVQGNLVRGLPSKTFKLDNSCLACKKGKQHRASCKKIEERTIREPLELLHMDLFGPVSVESVNKKKYCLVVTDDCSKFSWVFFLAYKDETYDMLHDLIVGLENRLRHKVKTIRCDHGTEFKNQLMNEFCALRKESEREYTLHGLLTKNV